MKVKHNNNKAHICCNPDQTSFTDAEHLPTSVFVGGFEDAENSRTENRLFLNCQILILRSQGFQVPL